MVIFMATAINLVSFDEQQSILLLDKCIWPTLQSLVLSYQRMRWQFSLGLIWEEAECPQEIQHWGLNTYSEFTPLLIYMPEVKVLVNVLSLSEGQYLVWLKKSYLGGKECESAFPY